MSLTIIYNYLYLILNRISCSTIYIKDITILQLCKLMIFI